MYNAQTMKWFGLLLLLAPVCLAQTGTAKIQGTVADASGAVVPGATVIALHTDTARQYTTTTNEAGLYLLPGVQNGQYVITIEAVGMEKFKGEFLLQSGATAV